MGAMWATGELRISVRKVIPWQDNTSQKVMGSNPCLGNGFFLQNLYSSDIECKLYIALAILSAHVADASKRLFKKLEMFRYLD